MARAQSEFFLTQREVVAERAPAFSNLPRRPFFCAQATSRRSFRMGTRKSSFFGLSATVATSNKFWGG